MPWSKYVPSWYYKKAESNLEKRDDPPERMPAFKKIRLDESAGMMETLYSEVGGNEDDETHDTTYWAKVAVGSPGQRTPPREAKPRQGSITSVSSSSAAVQFEGPSTPPAKRSRPVQDRKRSILARKDYSELTPTALREVESPGRGVMSWRHFGILVKFPPGTANAFEQTTGFPVYTPNLTKASDVEAIQALETRFVQGGLARGSQ
ncbi:unnamed protein product [Phytophthora fragariaefolia]|uniref:Unnamed protein product n=1 Tax=Phytophthora fragariaefolia TaxID=1490495 RepID=A0A9W6Y2B5_9STRA|nr:unnamed protein product [Phytophthora fragariaefolia]